jgi:phosphoglycolate phosphatase-like HAD superfamily hydrolase
MKDINFVITDLDDTIWDWLAMWYMSFSPYLERIAHETNTDIDVLKADFKKLHQKYGTTEMSFLYKELMSIDNSSHILFEQASSTSRSILHEYNSNKKNNLKSYPGVIDTLKEIKSKNSLIVAFTESNVFFTKYRIKHLGLDSIIDCVYSPEGHDLPSLFKYYPDEYWEPEKTLIKSLPKETRKPNAEILDTILNDFNADKNKSIYIGDKLDRDIYMAQLAGITSIYAKYGNVTHDKRYELLREVTHWSDEDVEREKHFKNQLSNIAPPDYTVDSFSEILDFFNFTEFKKNG